MRIVIAVAALLALTPAARAQGVAAGERARGEGRCPVGTVGEAVPGGYRCVRPELSAAPVQGAPPQAAGGQAQEVSRGPVGAVWPFAFGAAAILGGAIAAASQGGSSTTGTR